MYLNFTNVPIYVNVDFTITVSPNNGGMITFEIRQLDPFDDVGVLAECNLNECQESGNIRYEERHSTEISDEKWIACVLLLAFD